MDLHFREYGSGPPLVVLHGLLGSADNWATVARGLAEHFRVLVPDQRNHGRSPHSAELDYDSLTADLLEFVRAQGLIRAHVLGHSMGGKAAMQFALAHPSRVSRLVVVDIAPRRMSPPTAALRALLALDVASCPRRSDADSALAPAVPGRGMRRFLLKNLERRAEGGFRWRADLPVIVDQAPALAAAPALDGVVTTPALFVRGERSRYIRDEDVSAIRRPFPNARFVTIPGTGHWVHAEAPEAFLRVVIEFLVEGA